MTIVSLLATTILFGWRIAVSAWQKANTHLQRSRTVLETNQLLQEQIASMVWYQVQKLNGERVLFFQGEPQTARFLSRYSLEGRASSGLYRIEYHIEVAQDGTRQLLLNEFPVSGNEELAALIADSQLVPVSQVRQFAPFQHGSQTIVLLDGLRDCRFEYYKPPVGQPSGTWTGQWTNDMTELPPAIAIRITGRSAVSELEPVSIVAPIPNVSSEIPQEDQ